jgi:spore germination protein
MLRKMLPILISINFLVYSCTPIASPTSLPPSPTTPPATPIPAPTATSDVHTGNLVLAYFTGSESSIAALQSYADYLDIVSSDVYSVHADGSITGSDDFDAVKFDRVQGIHTYACVSNYNNDPEVEDFDPELARAAILTHKDEVIAQLVALANDGGFEGINIDLESIAYSGDIAADREAFTAFIRELAGKLHGAGKKLIISVPGKTEDSPDDDWSYPFDLAALGQAADYLQLMTYDQHGPWSEPGPVAGLDWVEACAAYASALVDPSKLLLGLPAYGYDWDLTASDIDSGDYTAGEFHWTDVPALIAKPGAETHWDEPSQSPYLTYTEDRHEHAAWFENEESIRVKAELVSKYHLAGIAVWALGQEDQSFWQAAADPIK